MPEFRVIGNELMSKYKQASQLRDEKIVNRVRKLKLFEVARRSAVPPPVLGRQDKSIRDFLIFIDKSPNFCARDEHFDSLGTSGRSCGVLKDDGGNVVNAAKNVTMEEMNATRSCRHLCCGRGYYATVKETQEDCDCQFQWCCSVKCKKCRKKVTEYFCK
jgi:hypothetical protein